VQADGNRPVLASGEVINVPVVRLDDLIDAGVPPPQLVKIDVEGGEYQVLCGAKKLFAKRRPLIIAEVHHQQAAEEITNWLSEYECAQWNIPREQFPRHLFAWPKRQMERHGCGIAALDRSLRKSEKAHKPAYSCSWLVRRCAAPGV
jgi:hypothetical protein